MDGASLTQTLSCPDKADWKAIVAKYQHPSFWRASWQLVNSVGAYFLLWFLAVQALQVSFWLTIPILLLMAGLLSRIFIIFHDCGHGSFFSSRLANDIWGYITGILMFTPYHHWRWRHSLHHSHANNLDRRGIGDVWTLTVDEYLQASAWKRLVYRVARHPLPLFIIGPFFYFLIRQRIPSRQANQRERQSVWWMNLGVLCWAVILSAACGFFPYLAIQLPSMALAASFGVWLFYVQHQFEDVTWERNPKWNWELAAMQGSSFYKLPKILQWFSGNIGFHHIHHLSSRIPNYNLAKCHYANAMFQAVKPLTLRESFKCLGYRLWDESSQKLVGFSFLKKLRHNSR